MTMTMTLPAQVDAGTSSIPLVEVEIDGTLDVSMLHSLHNQISEALTLHPELLAIDFARCRYLDAQAIRVLLDAHTLAWKRGTRMVLRNCQPDSIRLLAMAGVLRVFEMDPPQVPSAT